MILSHEIPALVVLFGGVFLSLKAIGGTYQKSDRAIFLIFSFFILIWGLLAISTIWLGDHPTASLYYIDLARKLVSGSLLGMFLSMCIYGAWKRL